MLLVVVYFAKSLKVTQGPILQPTQLALGIPGGCEAAIHSARRFLDDAQG